MRRIFIGSTLALTVAIATSSVRTQNPAENPKAEDANYVVSIINDTYADVSFILNRDKDGGNCVAFNDSKVPGQTFTIKPGTSKFVGFWRAGSCHGKQGTLAIRAWGTALPNQSESPGDVQSLSFSADGGILRAGRFAKYSNWLECHDVRVIGPTVPIDFHIVEGGR